MVLLILLFLPLPSFSLESAPSAKAPTMQWEQYYQNLGARAGDSVRWLIQTTNGDYVMAAESNPQYYGSVVCLLKANPSGVLQWQTQFFLTGASGLAQTSDGGNALAGALTRFNPDMPMMAIDPGNIVLVKTNTEGKMQWNQTYPYTGYKSAMTQTRDGGFVLAGTIDSPTLSDLWLVKTDSIGSVQWNKSFSVLLSGGISQLIQAKDGSYVLIGNTYSASTKVIDFGHLDLRVVKIDSRGNLVWDLTYDRGISNSGIKSIMEASFGGYFLLDTTGDSQVPSIIKIDNAGNVEWTRNFDAYRKLNAIIETSDGGLAFAGTATLQYNFHYVWLVKTDLSGNIEWNQTYGGQKYIEYGYVGSAIIETTDGSLAIGGGWSKSESTADYYLAKTHPILPPPTSSPPLSLSPTPSIEDNQLTNQIAKALAIILVIVSSVSVIFFLRKRRKANLTRTG
jgi:hypothetical protein